MINMTFTEELELILKRLLETIIELKQLSLEKTDLIINNNIEELEKLTKKEETLINKMGTIENERVNLLEIWGVGKNTPISDVIERVPDDNTQLIYIKDEMTKILGELDLRNRLNNDLIRENLDWIDFNMNLITSTPVEQNYGNEKSQGNGKSIFDRKV